MSQAYVSLARQNAVKSVRKLESEYQNILLGNLESALEGIKEVALELESSLYTLDPNEEVIEDKISNYKEMVELDENVKALVNEIANCKKSVVYLGQLAVNMSVGSVPLDGAKAWYQQHMNTSTTLTEEELAKDHNYRGFRDAVLKIRKPEESWGEDGEEDDIRMVGESISVYCPISVILS